VRTALVYPPTCDPTAPYLSVPMLTGFLRAHGKAVLPIDANVEAWDRILRSEPLRALANRAEARLSELDRRTSLDHAAQREYLQLWRARGDLRTAPDGIDEARAVLKDEVAFYDASRYERAVETIDSALRLVSASHAPLELSFTGYRTPFALTTPEEIALDAAADRDPFDDYITNVLVPRLIDQQIDLVGLSVCFPGQLQPAYAFGIKIARLLKAARPSAQVTVGGPAITQLLIKLRGQDLLRALGPFDFAVVFEGEHTLLSVVEALERGAPLRDLPNVVVRDALHGAKYTPGESAEDLRQLPAPDFDGLPLDLYFSPQLVLPYDPTRGCYWGKCTFCHYGLAEVGTASYRERAAETVVDHLTALRAKHGSATFYLSQDSVAPKTLLKIAQTISARKLDLRWATDLKPERYLTRERAEALRAGGGVACALGVESASPRVLQLIDKGAPVSTVRDVIGHLAGAGMAVEAMCFTDFPTETAREALETLRFLDELREQIALYIVGEFDLTEGALVAKEPERFGIKETYHLDGDLLRTGLFYEERRPPKRIGDQARIDRALDALSASWRVRRYPWAGSLSTAHSILCYVRFGPQVFRDRARELGAEARPFGARDEELAARFDLERVERSDDIEQQIWTELVRVRRHVSRAAYTALADEAPALAAKPAKYRVRAGEPPRPLQRAKGRRPSNASNAAG
jgi:anaerobic magnesium-protoporphyrin IX monomethyl ester cyclase